MITIIGKNVINWYLAAAFLLLSVIWLIAELFYNHYLGLSIVLQLMILFLLIKFFQLPTEVILDTDQNTIEVKFTFSGARLIHLHEIESFSSESIRNERRNVRYDGVILNLKTGKSILISEYSLCEYVSVYNYLLKANVPQAS